MEMRPRLWVLWVGAAIWLFPDHDYDHDCAVPRGLLAYLDLGRAPGCVAAGDGVNAQQPVGLPARLVSVERQDPAEAQWQHTDMLAQGSDGHFQVLHRSVPTQ